MKKIVILVLVTALLAGGCGTDSTSLSAQRVVGGGVIGAGSGALIGAAAGNPAAGAAIGGGAGLIGGTLYDAYEKSHGRP